MSRWWSWSNWLHVGSKESVRLISRISLIFDRLSKISPFLGDDSSFSWVQIVNLDSDVDVIWRYSSAYKNNLYYCHFHKNVDIVLISMGYNNILYTLISISNISTNSLIDKCPVKSGESSTISLVTILFSLANDLSSLHALIWSVDLTPQQIIACSPLVTLRCPCDPPSLTKLKWDPLE